MASTVVAQLLFLEAESPDAPIHLYINSPGGSVTAGMAVYDTMQFITSPVQTIVTGQVRLRVHDNNKPCLDSREQASSMASLLLAGGEPGHRAALPNASVMIHQPSGGAGGQVCVGHLLRRTVLTSRNRRRISRSWPTRYCESGRRCSTYVSPA